MADSGHDRRFRGEDSYRDPPSVERLKVGIASASAADDYRVDLLQAAQIMDTVRDGRPRLRSLDTRILHQDVDGGVLIVNRVLDVVRSDYSEGCNDTNTLLERSTLLFLLVVEPATLFEFATQALDGDPLDAIALVKEFRESHDKDRISTSDYSQQRVFDILYEKLDALGGIYVIVLDKIDNIGHSDDIFYGLPRARSNGYVDDVRPVIVGISNDFQFRDNSRRRSKTRSPIRRFSSPHPTRINHVRFSIHVL
ncbi:Cdc6-related protein, AAA superfamily ATPase (plasmid) [Halalkaliarchaeum sp. AArc-CO]|nr:Cdc6-related protein, AAA superfamily ATPase [Halalkaliarchaeum sp. AArc-CO]